LIFEVEMVLYRKTARLKGLRTAGLLGVGGVVGALLWAPQARAEQARFYNLEGFGTWLDGNPESTAITEDGEVTLPSPARERYKDSAASYSAAAAFGDDIAVAQVDDGRVLLVLRDGKTKEIFRSEERMITAMVASDDALFVAAGPPAKIYRVTKKGDATEYHTPDASFVWDLAVGPKGALYAVTGEPGTVLRIEKADGKGDGEVLFKSEQAHLRSVAYDARLGVLVGGGEHGVLYNATPDKPKAFHALFDSGHPEITGIVVQDGAIYVAGVTGAQALAAEEGNEQQSGKSKGPEVKSQLARVMPDGTSEVLAGSSDEAIFDVAVDARGAVAVATGATGRDDPRGRLYTIDPKTRQIAMVYQSASRRITHLLPLGKGALAAVASGGGRIVYFAPGLATKGEFFTTPFDTTINSRFGMVEIDADTPTGTKVLASVRTGQTSKPDETWTEWSNDVASPGQVAPKTEIGRYMQIRLTLQGDGKATPRVARVRLAYLRQNLRPFVREVVAMKKGLALLPLFNEESKNKNISLTDKGGNSGQSKDDEPTKNSTRARQVAEEGALTVKWVAEDPNGDELRYDLMVRGPGFPEWKPLKNDLEDAFFTLQAAQLADGHYQFRVRATDAPSNPDGTQETDTKESSAVLIDNTPPKIDPLQVTQNGRRVTVRGVIADAVGPLVDAGYALDGGRFKMIAPDDGVLDGPGESFTLRLGDLAPGPHTVTVRAQDEGENVGYNHADFVVK
jgi:hypothetical protein